MDQPSLVGDALTIIILHQTVLSLFLEEGEVKFVPAVLQRGGQEARQSWIV